MGEKSSDVVSDVLRLHAIDLEGVDSGLQIPGPFDQGRDARRLAVYASPQALEAPELWLEAFQLAQQIGDIVQHH